MSFAGGLNIDTPWLYLYTAHKLHQPQHSAYLLTSELTTGKALSVKDLVLELFYKDQGNEKEGKVHIYTPATTYLQVGDLVLHRVYGFGDRALCHHCALSLWFLSFLFIYFRLCYAAEV